MTDGIKGKKDRIGGVSGTGSSSGVDRTASVGDVQEVKKTGEVQGLQRSQQVGNRRTTRLMSAAEREKLFQMINEEAEKLFGENGLPKEQREIVENAVKMAIDASILDDEE